MKSRRNHTCGGTVAPDHSWLQVRNMTPTITAFESSPDKGQGHARDFRVRWAFEEVGQPHDVALRSFEALKQPEHLLLNPFGSIPTYECGDLALFESGAIVLHIAERHPGLLPTDPGARARAIMWIFAALNTVEPSNFPEADNLVKRFPNLSAYVERAKHRPAYKRAFAAQLAVFENAPK
jgi:glutathione S-transferase